MNPYLRRTLIVIASVGAVVALLLSGWYKCPFAAVVGYPCPGCGLTRATLDALHGNWKQSFHHHPLAIVIVPIFAAYVVANAVSYVRHGTSKVDQMLNNRWVTVLSLIIFIALFVLWIARFFGAFGGPVPV